MAKNKPIIHGPFQDDINYNALFELQSKQGVTKMPFPKEIGKSKGPQKTKFRRNNQINK